MELFINYLFQTIQHKGRNSKYLSDLLISRGCMDVHIQTSQLKVGELFDAGWSLYQKNFRNILQVILCVYIPVNLITVLVRGSTIYYLFEDGDSNILETIFQLLEYIIGPITTLSISAIIEKSLQGTVFGWGFCLPARSFQVGRDDTYHASSRHYCVSPLVPIHYPRNHLVGVLHFLGICGCIEKSQWQAGAELQQEPGERTMVACSRDLHIILRP
jgi:hypothetical protein